MRAPKGNGRSRQGITLSSALAHERSLLVRFFVSIREGAIMLRALRLAGMTLLLAIGASACATTDRQTDASPARVAGSGNSVYAPGAGLAEFLPDPYHYRCTGQCLGL